MKDQCFWMPNLGERCSPKSLDDCQHDPLRTTKNSNKIEAMTVKYGSFVSLSFDLDPYLTIPSG